jgi:hypothetical protein
LIENGKPAWAFCGVVAVDIGDEQVTFRVSALLSAVGNCLIARDLICRRALRASVGATDIIVRKEFQGDTFV